MAPADSRYDDYYSTTIGLGVSYRSRNEQRCSQRVRYRRQIA